MPMKIESENPLELMNEMEEACLLFAEPSLHTLTPRVQKLLQALELAGAMLGELSNVQSGSEPKVAECIGLYLKRIEVHGLSARRPFCALA